MTQATIHQTLTIGDIRLHIQGGRENGGWFTIKADSRQDEEESIGTIRFSHTSDQLSFFPDEGWNEAAVGE